MEISKRFEHTRNFFWKCPGILWNLIEHYKNSKNLFEPY